MTREDAVQVLGAISKVLKDEFGTEAPAILQKIVTIDIVIDV